MKSPPPLHLRILQSAGIDPATVTRGHRRRLITIPPNMAARYTAGESAAWNHSPLAGALWEAGTRSARAILLSENARKNMFDGISAPCQLPPVTTDTRPGGPGNLQPNQKMKTTTRTAEFTVILKYDPKLPHVITIDGPNGLVGDDIYCNESDGSRAQDWLPNEIIPTGGKLESDGREAWISHWNDETLAQLDGRTYQVRFSQTFEINEDGENEWISDEATVLP
jgi:hypothetical protein